MLRQKTRKKISTGKYYPIGASIQNEGVNFAIFSKHAKEVFLLLFDEPDSQPADIIKLDNCTRHIWHVFVHGIMPGQLYGYKIKGDYDPANGMRFNENKLIMDPYAKAITGKFANTDNLLLAYDPDSKGKDAAIDKRDNAQIVPKSIVIDNYFDWQGDIPPDIPFQDLIIYETHLKGFTAHHSSRVKKRGSYLGFIEKVPYLKDLGINAIEFLPIHEFYVDDFLKDKRLTNFWGYNTIGFFAPESSYAAGSAPGCQVNEFKTLVREIHKSSIEVILDVVYNHTGEGNELGPTISFKGIDNLTYYCLSGDESEPYRYYKNYTGCGNSMNLSNPQCMRMVMDSLRYWVEEMHVDGFRFDLAAVLGREGGMFDKSSSFFDAISQDPVLCKVKMIAEPWDVETYKVGDFPIDWSEWNGRFRDSVRKFVKGDNGQVRDMGFRLTGSSDLFGGDGRQPHNSINFVTCHDGFTLFDLVSYENKHNEANGEENRDGMDDNNSWNCGVEGYSDDKEILRLRTRQVKNLFCCLFFSLGTPMMLAGDEMLRTQNGNNNAYCQDNKISWVDWLFLKKNRDIVEFCKKAISFRNRYPVLKKKKFYLGRDTSGNNILDITWYGTDMGIPDWGNPNLRTICYQLNGAESRSLHEDYLLYLILNSDRDSQNVKLPKINGKQWFRVLDTSLPPGEDFMPSEDEKSVPVSDVYSINPGTITVLIGA